MMGGLPDWSAVVVIVDMADMVCEKRNRAFKPFQDQDCVIIDPWAVSS